MELICAGSDWGKRLEISRAADSVIVTWCQMRRPPVSPANEQAGHDV